MLNGDILSDNTCILFHRSCTSCNTCTIKVKTPIFQSLAQSMVDVQSEVSGGTGTSDGTIDLGPGVKTALEKEVKVFKKREQLVRDFKVFWSLFIFIFHILLNQHSGINLIFQKSTIILTCHLSVHTFLFAHKI